METNLKNFITADNARGNVERKFVLNKLNPRIVEFLETIYNGIVQSSLGGGKGYNYQIPYTREYGSWDNFTFVCKEIAAHLITPGGFVTEITYTTFSATFNIRWLIS